MDKLLHLLDTNARLTTEQLAVMADMTEEQVEAHLASLEEQGVIRGYKALIDWDRTDHEVVTAVIDLQIAPTRDRGFDGIAEMIMNFDEVESLHLMSGGYDLLVTLTGHSFRDVAIFVAKRLAPIEGVLSAATHFVLKTYKERGVLFTDGEKDERNQL